MRNLQNKVAIVTGGASGIGRSLCEELARRGSIVVIADVNESGASEVASRITSEGFRGLPAKLDVSQLEEVTRLVSQVASEYGRLDYMFNNAGIGVGGEFRDLEIEDWRRVLDVNLWGAVNGAMAAYPIMVKQGHGHIVNVSSVAGLCPSPVNTPYCAAKWAIVGFSTALRAEAKALGVRVSVVCPGSVQTPVWETSPMVNVDQERISARLRQLKKMEPEKAALKILSGVRRNRAIIVFPGLARVVWWLYRIHPSLFTPFSHYMVKEFRELRNES